MLSFLSVSLFCCSQPRLLLSTTTTFAPPAAVFPFFCCTLSPFNAFLYYNLSLSPLHLIASLSFRPPNPPIPLSVLIFIFSRVFPLLCSPPCHRQPSPPLPLLSVFHLHPVPYALSRSPSSPPSLTPLRWESHNASEGCEERRGSSTVPILHSFHTSASEECAREQCNNREVEAAVTFVKCSVRENCKCTGRTLACSLKSIRNHETGLMMPKPSISRMELCRVSHWPLY